MSTTRSLARFDVWTTVFSGWMTVGVFLDGWGHHHGATEDFLTPWHFFLYSGYVLLAATLFGYPIRRRRRGIRPAIPPGYKPAVWGAAIFAFGGFADGVWHTLFGIEHKVEAFVSPPHMTLFASGVIMVSGPLCALRYRARVTRTWPSLLPAVLSVAFAVGLIQFATENDNALLLPAPGGEQLIWAGPLGPKGVLPFEIGVGYGLAAVVVQTLLIAGTVIVLRGRMRPPFGALTLSLLIGVGHSVVIHNMSALLIVIAVAGLVGDTLLSTSLAGRVGSWVAPTVVPAVTFAGWLVAIAARDGLVWSTHLVTGAVATAAVTGAMVALIGRAGQPASGPGHRGAGTTARAVGEPAAEERAAAPATQAEPAPVPALSGAK
jgi:hypothetical protein